MSIPEEVHIHDRSFRVIISYDQILDRVEQLSQAITRDYKDLNPVFLPLLNGSFMFAADLMRIIRFPCEIEFIKAQSYQGVKSRGHVDVTTHFNRSLEGRHLIILEDIVDTGHTVQKLFTELSKDDPASISVATVLIKPEALEVDIKVRYSGFQIGNEFVVGYGLDYDGLGRNLPGIYQEIKD